MFTKCQFNLFCPTELQNLRRIECQMIAPLNSVITLAALPHGGQRSMKSKIINMINPHKDLTNILPRLPQTCNQGIVRSLDLKTSSLPLTY
jgi:hypothetical protein